MKGQSGRTTSKPRQAPETSINRLATRTDRVTVINYNETEKLRNRDSRGGMMAQPALIRMEMIGRLQHRDLVLRSVAAACKLVTPPADSNALQEFRMQVVTAVGEAFNNIVLHSYAGREDGIVEMDIKTQPDHISIEFRDWGDSFDPDAVPLPDLENLPESGLGIFIIKTLMDISYAPGKPNVLTLSKSLETNGTRSYEASVPAEGKR